MIGRAIRLVAAGVVVALGLLIAVPAPGHAATGTPCTSVPAESHAAVVVEHSGQWSAPGAVVTACVGFAGTAITAEQLLHLSGIEYQVEGNTGYHMVCQVDSEPATYPDPCLAAGMPYWEILIAHAGGGWTAASQGISTAMIASGDALGLHYVAQDSTPADPPSPWSVCRAAATPPAATALPAASASSRPSGVTGPARQGSAASAGAVPGAASASAAARPASPGATPTGAVEAVTTTTPLRTAGPAPPAAAGPSVAAIVGFALLGGLGGLAVLQVQRRRR